MREMKDSGIEWIGEMPKGWTINRIKNLFSNCKGLSITKENLIDNGLPVISYGQIHSKENDGTSIKKCLLRYVDYSYQKNNPKCEVRKNDFVFADTSEDYEGCGNCVYKRDDTLLFGGYHSIILHSICNVNDNRYLAYLFKTDSWRKQIRETASGVKVYSVTQKALMNTSVILPTFPEQKSIADFLDSKCSEIDGLISDIQKQITTLEEYKRSVITKSVTKGLNPDAEMKDSGVEWIGVIPKHWKIEKIKYHLKRDEPRNPGNKQVLSVYREYGVIPKDSRDDNHNVTSDDTSKYKYVVKNNLVINKMKAWQGSMGVSDYEGIVSPAYFIYIFTSLKLLPKYIHYLFRSSYKDEFRRISGGIREGQWDLSADEFENTVLLIPTISEQHKIIDYIQSKTNKIDSIISEKKKQIETIEEYKKSLIFEYVTGKKEVYVNE